MPTTKKNSIPDIAVPLYEKMIQKLSTDIGKEIGTGGGLGEGEGALILQDDEDDEDE